MLIKLSTLEPYSDDHGNVVQVSGDYSDTSVNLWIRGKNNRITIAEGARLGRLTGSFDGDNGVLEIGAHRATPAGLWHIRVGQDSSIIIGEDVSCTTMCILSAVEGTTLKIGDDCMLAAECAIRADDAHAIYDVPTGARVNHSQDVTLGRHVWMGHGSTVLAGVTIAPGAVIGAKSVVTKDVPNNSVAVGNPARTVRRNIAWERPHLSLAKPAFRPDASVIEKRGVWEMTLEEEEPPAKPASRWRRAWQAFRTE